MKKYIIILALVSLIIRISAQTVQTRVAVNDLEFTGIEAAEAASFQEAIVSLLQQSGQMVIVKEVSKSDYFLASTVKKEENLYDLSILIHETESGLVIDAIWKKADSPEKLLDMIYGSVNTLVEHVFRVDTYLAKNKIFFQKTDPLLLGENPVASTTVKNGQNITMVSMGPIHPVLTENFFKKYKIAVSVLGAGNLPLNLLGNDINPQVFLKLSSDYTFLASNVIMLAAFIDANYFSLEKVISATGSNVLHIITMGGGVGICASLPFYRPLSFHLNAGGGYAISFLKGEQFDTALPISGDPFLQGQFDFRWAFSEQVAINLNVSYVWLIYVNTDIHNLLIGGGLTYRF